MFKRVLAMDLKRCFFSGRLLAVIAVSAFLLFSTEGNNILFYAQSMSREERNLTVGAVDFLYMVMLFDIFKVVIVLMLSGLYTGSFCKDENTHYLRMVLSRTDSVTYARAKFFSNVIVIVTASVLTCCLFVFGLMLMGYPLISKGAQGGMLGAAYYKYMLAEYPFVYVLMTGLQFGMVISACSSVGMLFSAYQANAYISIGISGFLFFMVMSFSLTVLNGTIFDTLNLVGMIATLPGGMDTNPWLMFAWGMLYPAIVITICCVLFERRMKWRCENGII